MMPPLDQLLKTMRERLGNEMCGAWQLDTSRELCRDFIDL